MTDVKLFGFNLFKSKEEKNKIKEEKDKLEKDKIIAKKLSTNFIFDKDKILKFVLDDLIDAYWESEWKFSMDESKIEKINNELNKGISISKIENIKNPEYDDPRPNSYVKITYNLSGKLASVNGRYAYAIVDHGSLEDMGCEVWSR